jgi:hypothetical protein
MFVLRSWRGCCLFSVGVFTVRHATNLSLAAQYFKTPLLTAPCKSATQS